MRLYCGTRENLLEVWNKRVVVSTLRLTLRVYPSTSRPESCGLDAVEWVKDVLDMEIGSKHPLLQPQARIGVTFPQHADTHL